MAEVRIMQFSPNVAQCFISLSAKSDDKIRKGSPDVGVELGLGGFRLRDAISRKRCEIELR